MYEPGLAAYNLRARGFASVCVVNGLLTSLGNVKPGSKLLDSKTVQVNYLESY